MARIPEYHQQQLQRLEQPNPGVDTSALEVGNSVLQDTNALAQDVNQSNAHAQSVVSGVFGAAVSSIVHVVHAQAIANHAAAIQAKAFSDANAKTLATTARRDTFNQIDAVKQLGAQQPNSDMWGDFQGAHSEVVDKYIKQNYIDPKTNKVTDAEGLAKFKAYMNEDLTSKQPEIARLQAARDAGVAQDRWNVADITSTYAAAKSGGDPAELKDIIAPYAAQNGKEAFLLSTARHALPTEAQAVKVMHEKVQSLVKNGAESALTLNRDESLKQAKGDYMGALKLESDQLNRARQYLNDPIYGDNLSADDMQKFQHRINEAQQANLTATEQGLDAKTEEKLLGASMLGFNGIQAARQGDAVTANKVIQDIDNQLANANNSAQALEQQGHPAQRVLKLVDHLKAQREAISNAGDQFTTRTTAEQQKAFMLGVQKDYASETAMDSRVNVNEALRLLPDLNRITGSPEDYQAIGRARQTLNDAVKTNALGYGKDAETKISGMYGKLNAVLQIANTKKSDATAGVPEALHDMWNSLTAQVKPAPQAVQNALNPGNDKRLHATVNDQWVDDVSSKVNEYKANPKNKALLDSSGNVPSNIINNVIIPKIQNDFTKAFKQSFPGQPVDAQGNPVNAFMPPPPAGVQTAKAPANAEHVVKFGKQKTPPPTLVPPPPPMKLSEVLPPGTTD